MVTGQWTGRVRLVAVVLAVVALSACVSEPGSVSTAPSGQEANGSLVDSPRECSADERSPLYVEGEPDWRQYGDYTPWTDVNGCLIRIDVLAERTGPDHCGWGDSRVIITGDPFGTRYTDDSTWIEYVRDPNGVYDVPTFVDGFQVLDSLPDNATDTGYRQGNRELWISPDDPDAIFLRYQAVVEQWPRSEVPGCL